MSARLLSRHFPFLYQIGDKQAVDYSIRSEPVHYDMYARDHRCGSKALKDVLRVNGSLVGALGEAHGKIQTSRHSGVHYDERLSLYPGRAGNIIGRSFVVQQGDNEADYRCATIMLTDAKNQRPGVVPCELRQYSDCLVGTADDDLCVYRPCGGYRQFWGKANDRTQMCGSFHQIYPKSLKDSQPTRGTVRCKHGNHTLLRPHDESMVL